MKQRIGFVFACIFIGAGVFAFYNSVKFFRSNQVLIEEIDYSLKPKIIELQLDKVRLEEEFIRAKESLKNLEEEYSRASSKLFEVEKELAVTRKQLQGREKRFAEVSAKFEELKKSNNELQERFGIVLAEHIKMKQIMSSVEGLRKAMAELKKKQEILGRAEDSIRERSRRRGLPSFFYKDSRVSEGNRGYLVKDGRSTFIPRAKIRVMPVEE